MTATATLLLEVPLVSGAGARQVAIDEAGTVHVFQPRRPEEESEPRISITHAQAMALARAVLAGEERPTTGRHSLLSLAAALVAIDKDLEQRTGGGA